MIYQNTWPLWHGCSAVFVHAQIQMYELISFEETTFHDWTKYLVVEAEWSAIATNEQNGQSELSWDDKNKASLFGEQYRFTSQVLANIHHDSIIIDQSSPYVHIKLAVTFIQIASNALSSKLD